ncbi:hypothetical protein K431DRAFT_288002 [Polychaeton citri CBS 116435]|uniref:Uncharacterized protein n=1 Tax=Polychaeton citri CBS 116435 TaxID=1314669 RepID=A0A9P4UL21_9PEZI|nr:hypothetical protein K431DRAFT_288002 [Polychaeton citri CBS 116435]
MSTEYGSGPGFGNKTASSDMSNYDNSDLRLGSHEKSDPYSGGTEYGSGATGGAGSGNKLTSASSDSDTSTAETAFGRTDSNPYSGGTELGSGTVGGAGFGNKTSSHSEDSTMGKLMQKAGSVMHNDALAEKGRAKREVAGAELPPSKVEAPK